MHVKILKVVDFSSIPPIDKSNSGKRGTTSQFKAIADTVATLPEGKCLLAETTLYVTAFKARLAQWKRERFNAGEDFLWLKSIVRKNKVYFYK